MLFSCPVIHLSLQFLLKKQFRVDPSVIWCNLFASGTKTANMAKIPDHFRSAFKAKVSETM